MDHFTSGQHCDETGMGRSSEVHIQCCRGLHVNAANIDTVNTVKNSRVDGTDGVEVRSAASVFGTLVHIAAFRCVLMQLK